MASIQRLGDTKTRRYRVHYRTGSGQLRSKTFELFEDARRFENEKERELTLGVLVDPNLAKMTVEDFVGNWLARPRVERPSTQARDESYLRSHVVPYFGAWRLRDVTRPEVQVWAHLLSTKPPGGRKRPLAPASVHKCAQVFAKVLEAAVMEGRLAVNPVRGVQLPKVADDEARFLSPDELLALEEAVPEPWTVLVPFLADTGLRIGEAAGLRWRDLDVWKGLVSVREILVEVRGHLTYGPPKTSAGRRTVPTLTREVAERLEVFRADPAELVFRGPHGAPLSPSRFRARVWKPAVERAELAAPTPTPHSLRHTAVAHWIAAGVEPYKLAKWAGHRSVATIYRLYGHLLDVDATDEREALSAIRQAAVERRETNGKVLRLGRSGG